MTSTTVPTLVAVLVLALVTTAIVAALRLERPGAQAVAIARAALQLGLLSLVLHGIIEDARLVAAFLVLMLVAATWTVRTRAGLDRHGLRTFVVLLAAAGVPLAVVAATGAVGSEPRYLLATGGIVIGGAMTAASLMGRQLHAGLAAGTEEVEGWLALGATPRRAALRLVRAAASTALVPATDQTRTTGLVTLPGAFVGAVFAGASPLEAAQFQLVVLAAALAAGAVVAATTALLFGAPRRHPE
ncbi:ABC transporter permease [Rathayibacter caricis]|uniref:ABC transporter permease n=1 Tax=Rathayibacter caricis TaxID=110936 RepID=UPI001FB1ACB4|nr:ABC transporter permease [Rathayibacter caricis]MCJ1695829.1 ABC transporter permease [Rathayibacter caricis]